MKVKVWTIDAQGFWEYSTVESCAIEICGNESVLVIRAKNNRSANFPLKNIWGWEISYSPSETVQELKPPYTGFGFKVKM